MKQKDIDILMEKIDRKCKLPKQWNKFIEKKTKEHNYLMKDTENRVIYCTHCNHTFYDTKYTTKHYKRCPNCNKEFYIVSNKGYAPDFKKSVLLLQRMDKQIIIRVFEICDWLDKENKIMDRDIQEYCRIIPGIGKFVSDNVYFYMWDMKIYHYSENRSWRQYKGCRYFSDYEAYPYNKQRLLKGTHLEYAPIKDFCRRNWRYNFVDAVELAGYESFELLWKLKLYNLSFHARKLNKKGSFYKRFGLSKEYLGFMQKYDVDYKELLLLRELNVPDYELLRRLYSSSTRDIKFYKNEGIFEAILNTGKSLWEFDVNTLKAIKKYIPLKKLALYKKGLDNLHIYKDYLEMANELSLNYKSNKDLFPRNLISRHDKMQTKIKVNKDKESHFGVYLRYLELSKYTYEDDKYIIFPAPSIDEMQEEGRQQKNCVGYRYVDSYRKKETEIYFIRQKDNIEKSLITMEYKKGKIVQRELAEHKTDFTKEQLEFMDKWKQFREFIVQKEKYQVKVINYKLKKLAA